MKFLSVVFAGALALTAASAIAHEYKIGSIEIAHPWSRATPKGASIAAGYLKITNKGAEPDRLIGGAFAVAGRFEIHEMTTVDGVMKMRPLANGLVLKPGETVEFKPGSFHLMFVDLKEPVVQGKRVKGTLAFEKAGAIEIEYVVEAIGGAPAGQTGQGGMHGH
jgi:hypothetical protein